MLTYEWFMNWLQFYGELFGLLSAICFLILVLGVIFREGRRSRTEAERLAEFMGNKYPPLTEAQFAQMAADHKEWERKQYLKEGGR